MAAKAIQEQIHKGVEQVSDIKVKETLALGSESIHINEYIYIYIHYGLDPI